MSKTLWDRVLEETNLVSAWEHVRSRDAADGWLGPSVARFAESPLDRLAGVRARLAEGRFEPSPLTPVSIPKSDGTARQLHIPRAVDRIVERAVSVVVSPLIEPHLSPRAFGYRRGLGVSDATATIAKVRDEGYLWAVRTDFDDCFASIPRGPLLRQVESIIHDSMVVGLVRTLVEREGIDGLHQGGSLSPALSNLYLTVFDDRLAGRGVPHVRFADDMVLLAADQHAAAHALQIARDAAERIDMALGDDKTEVVSFRDGFCFLGEDFNENHPRPDPHARRSQPTRRTLYVGRKGSRVSIQRGRIVVALKDDELLSVPSAHMRRMVLAGPVALSAGARSWALNEGVDVVLLSRRGNFLGTLDSAMSGDAKLRRLQYGFTDDPTRCLGLAKYFVSAKLGHQRALLDGYSRTATRSVVPAAMAQISALTQQAELAETLDELRGIEGMAARQYFRAWRVMLPADAGFEGRVRRPPSDVVNAALGYGYAILLGEAVSAVASAGLDPMAGALHADARRRPSLGLDLMEEFRPLVVDRVVVEAVRRERLTSDHEREDPKSGGVLLTEEGRRRLMRSIENRMLKVAYHPVVDARVSYRRALLLQARQVAAYMGGDRDSIESVPWR